MYSYTKDCTSTSGMNSCKSIKEVRLAGPRNMLEKEKEEERRRDDLVYGKCAIERVYAWLPFVAPTSKRSGNGVAIEI